MSLHFLLDAYNIIYQIPQLAKGNLEEQRDKLIAFVDAQRPQGSPKNAVTIVFDGRPGHSRPRPGVSSKIIFSLDETADEKIMRLVDESTDRKNIIVVTNDRSVQYAVRALGARVIGVQEFIDKGDPGMLKRTAARRTKNQKRELSKEISLVVEGEINEEMKSIWLKKKGHKP